MSCKILILLVSALTFSGFNLSAQKSDTLLTEHISFHAQSTVISQIKPSFSAKYSGENSLLTASENRTSITSTLFVGARLWQGASIFVNSEIAGGSGLSSALGIAAAPNGETFRIGDPAPQLYLARLFFRQVFSLGNQLVYKPTDFNQLAEWDI